MTRARVAFVFLCVVFGTTFGAIKIGIADGWPPLLAAGTRFASAGAIVLGAAAWRGELRPLRRADARTIAAIGLSVTAGTFGALYCAERVLPSGLAALFSAASPLFAVALAIVAQRRAPSLAVAASVVLGSLGVALVAGVGGARGGASFVAAGAIVASGFGYAWGLSQARRANETIPMLQLAGAQQLAGGLVLLALSLAFEGRLPTHAGAPGIFALAYLIVVASAGAHTVSIWLASRTDATFATSWTYVSPFVALTFGAVFLHESIGIVAWLGGACVVVAAVTLTRDRRTRGVARGNA
ncbi:MAG: hypothetical protein NVS3B17_15970 [Vulcanimicrobiaceae bacterium]